MNWRKNIKKWLSSVNSTAAATVSGDENALTPIILRHAMTTENTVLAVLPTLAMADKTYAELENWRLELDLPVNILYLPEIAEGNMYLPGNESARARALYDVLHNHYDLIVGSALSFLSSTPSPEYIRDSEIIMIPGMHIPFNDLLKKLVELDYDDEFEVNVPGEFSRRGGIIDVYSPEYDYPARIEFWGDQIESIRRFSPESQRSEENIESYRVIARGNLPDTGDAIDFFDYLSGVATSMNLVFPRQCAEHLKAFATPEAIARFDELIQEYGSEMFRICNPVDEADAAPPETAGCFPAAGHLRNGLPNELHDGGMEMLRQLIAEQIKQWLNTGYVIGLLGHDDGALSHINSWLREHEIPTKAVELDSGSLPEGIIFPSEKTVFLTEKELFTANIFQRKTALPQTEAPAQAKDEATCADLDEGDYAVHLVHGIGRFHGIKEIETRGVTREVLALEYRDNATVYVPMWQAGMVSRYIGSQGQVKLHKLGSRKWTEVKAGTERAIKDFAAELLRFQAVRNAATGISFPDDNLEQRVFEDAFPYEDTADQARSVNEIKQDMTASKTMDRLLCGDVGYGKTEVAIRVAFKAVSSGRQVAILVPTTVLAQQHTHSFRERFAEYPYTVDTLSRFKSKAEQTETVKKLRSGGIDVIIGTHRLLQRDIGFAKLGLVIIDEEQRFGVKHKELIKRYRTAVDVLTMSATPIPRTLYMAMAGARDLSTLMTAPGFRLPVKTIVAQYSENFIEQGIRKEVGRGGQVFFIHNRVKSINDAAEKFMRLLPEVRFGVAHGQMPEEKLEMVMNEFLSGNIDVLVCTTIIESGLDIPNANTIIIERADRFGLAELYQLRGRVGRWNRQAYAYLLLPKHNIISSDAHKRLSAIRRYTHLGAGFRLALRDLEIRGAGNLLGAEQSGHINNIGFDLYCQLLRTEISRLQGNDVEFMPMVDVSIEFIHFAHSAPENSLPAGFPPEYIPSERLRIDAYRRLSRLTSEDEIDNLSDELEDRYGALPEPAANMLTITRIRQLAAHAGYTAVCVAEGKVFFKTSRGTVFRNNGIIPTINTQNPPKLRLRHLLDIARLLPPLQKG